MSSDLAAVRYEQMLRMVLPYAGFRLIMAYKTIGVSHNCNFSVTFRFHNITRKDKSA